ncbi:MULTISPECIES: MarR family transcriptional regulator [Streptomyces]|uniref:MarR family transcriptional regulator n=1 Tax=Streptomyces TaxID=1883 RepID=UPI00369195E5
MDLKEVSTKITEPTKSALGTITNALDVVAPVCAPFAAKWDAEANRRMALRTPENLKRLMDAQKAHNSARATAAAARSQRQAARSASMNPLSAGRRAARTADKAARTHRETAKAALKSARKDYPATLKARAVQAHAVHAVPGAVSSWLMSTVESWTIWPASVSAGLIALNAGALWLGRRTVTVAVDDALSAEERRLVERLDPSHWVQHADERGLSGTVPAPVEITSAGLVTTVRLDGRWKPSAFAAKHEEIRALLGARTDLRMEIKPGSHGDRATITLRTRSAADGVDLEGWKPGDCWAVDTVTGEPLPVPLGKRMLIAGTSGAGKSYSARPLLAEASEYDDHRLIIFDRKYVEGRTWSHRARIVCELDEMREVCQELIDEGEERLQVLPRGKDVVDISPERPRITVFADEGGELLSDAKTKVKGEDGKTSDYQDIVETLRTVARKYRAAEIILVWATQKPTMSGDGHGIDSQIAGQMSVKLGLAVASQTDAATVFGRSDWPAHDLPMPGYALLFDQDKGKHQRRNPIRLRYMKAQQVIDLPDRPVWRRETGAGTSAPAPLRLVKGEDYELAPPAAAVPAQPKAQPTNREKVAAAIGAGSRTVADVANVTGINKGSVSKAVKSLVEAGEVVKAADGTLSLPVAGEVSA